MTLPRRNLTIHFQQSISTATGKPDTVEVAVVPLATPSSPTDQATFVGGVQTQEIVLSEPDNLAVFALVPTDDPGLTERVIYRVGWRNTYFGREYTFDIVMPDSDIDFDQLSDLGNVLGGETYLKRTDRNRPGGVAGLDDNGNVVDAHGVVMTGDDAATLVSGRVDNEIIDRQAGDRDVQNALENELSIQITEVGNTTAANLAVAVTNVENLIAGEAGQRATADNSEYAARVAADNAEAAARTAADGTLQSHINTNAATTTSLLAAKADLDGGGHVPIGQIPAAAITNWVILSDANQRFSLLFPADIQLGDLALTPTGVFGLIGGDPSNPSDWYMLSKVQSVNGHTGDVVLAAADVGALPLNQAIPQSQVTGLVAALTAKADASTVTGINTRLSNIESDSTYVHTSGGVIDHTLNDSNMAYVNNLNQVVKKDGTTLTTGGSAVSSVNGHTGAVTLAAADVGAIATGASILQSQVTGLSASLAAKTDNTDSRLSDARTPTSHHTTHSTGGTDPIAPHDIGALATGDSINQSQVTGLSAIISNNSLTSSSNHGNRVSSLETRVTDLEGGGGGSGGVSAAKMVYYDHAGAVNSITNLPDFQQVSGVIMHTPWGVAASDGSYYYDPAGAMSGEEAFPFVTPNGHLKLYKWDETGAADPTYALQSDLTALSSTVSGKADETDLTTLTATVATKADASALTTTNATVSTKANQSSLDTTNATVANKANQSALDSLTTTVGTKASQSDLTTLTTTVGTKASQSDMTAAQSNITALQTGKADLVSGTVPLAQLPSNIPQSDIQGLVAALSAKADLSGGVLASGQIPTNIPQSSVANLVTNLANKADLVSGKVPTNQLPAFASHETYAVANRAAMLALTQAQVQIGDNAIITATADQGTYTLISADPSFFSSWLLNQPPPNAVASINGQTGIVVLGPSDVGAIASNAAIPQSQITGLVGTLASLATSVNLAAAIATVTTPAQVDAILTASAQNKQQARLVATGNVASTSGQQSIDGILAGLGDIVLLTAQTSSINNGLWVVASGAWTRATDMAAGSYLVRGSTVTISDGTSIANKYSEWQVTTNGGIVATDANNWVKVGWAAPPVNAIQGNGITITGTYPNLTITFNPVAGGGLLVSGSGAAVDPNIVTRKFAIDVPSNQGTTPTITHNLNTKDIVVSLQDKASGIFTLIGWTATGVNTIVPEFNSTPATGQWRIVVVG